MILQNAIRQIEYVGTEMQNLQVQLDWDLPILNEAKETTTRFQE
jgi:hypothetical protein